MAFPGGRDDDAPAGFYADGSLAEEQLALPADERLPWLESGEEDEQPPIDPGRIAVFAGVAALLIAVLLGGTWWLLADRSQGELVADGSLIEAPDQPYKTRPDNPGGIEVAGTGATSFAVAEGRQVEGQLAGNDPPAPRIDLDQPDTPAPAVPEPAPPAGTVGVQVGAYNTRAQAEAGWNTLAGRMEPLQGRSHRVVEGMADSGRIFRLQALAGSVAEAETLCQSIKAAGGDCQVKR